MPEDGYYFTKVCLYPFLALILRIIIIYIKLIFLRSLYISETLRLMNLFVFSVILVCPSQHVFLLSLFFINY